MSDYARRPKRKYCVFCKDHAEYIDYKDVNMLRKFMTDRGKIKPRRVSGNCAQHQHQISTCVKRAREMALVPYTVPVISGKVDGKRGR
ncbi:MAG: 30S ribosomal protein S18 [Coriobacteriia bacterium]|nr:30S ribosomal protein S18 [Coriobacteriia bacterium]MBN2822077.1 30S ribosomal protein S18 [Coriobacteriia bacterium]